MARNHVKTIRAVHVTASDPHSERLVISARLELLGSWDSSTIARRKDKLATSIHDFLRLQGYGPLNISFHKTRQ